MFTQPFFPHFNSLGSDFAPIFRLLDSATADLVPLSRQARHTFTPRFDVREAGNSYQLQGEVPGFQQEDLSLEFSDERTLVIRGRTGNESTKANEAAEAVEAVKAVENDDAKDNGSEKSVNYKKPSAEEEEEYVDAGAESEGAKTPASTNAEVAPAAEKAAEPSFKYWVNERSVGEFERRFSFPGRIELDNVKASLKNGILSVAIPKALKESRRITIE